MGATDSKKLRHLQMHLPVHKEFEVFMPVRADNTSIISLGPSNTWCILQFSHKDTTLLVSKEDIVIEKIQLDQYFEVVNEQPDDFIFTIEFQSNTESLSRWKIRCKSLEDFQSWTLFLKKALRRKWKDEKVCQICSKGFGVFSRKHHCRKCGKCICDGCSPIRSTLPELAYTDMVRICIECGRYIESNRKGISQIDTPNFSHHK